MAVVILAPRAMRDIEKLIQYVAVESPRAATRLTERIEDAIGRLSDFPNNGRARNDIAQDARALILPPYIILYRLERDLVVVTRFVDGRSNPKEWL